MKKKATINFEINLDENHIPEEISWSASDSDFESKKAKAIMISILGWRAEKFFKN